MSNHPHPKMPAKTANPWFIYGAAAVEVVLAVFYAVTGEWTLAIVFTVLALSAFVMYPIVKRMLVARDAASAKADSTHRI